MNDILEIQNIAETLNKILDDINATGIKFYCSNDNCIQLQLRKSPSKNWNIYTYYLAFNMVMQFYDNKPYLMLMLRHVVDVVDDIKYIRNKMMSDVKKFLNVSVGYIPHEHIFRQHSEWKYEDINDTAINFLELLSKSESLEEFELNIAILGY